MNFGLSLFIEKKKDDSDAVETLTVSSGVMKYAYRFSLEFQG